MPTPSLLRLLGVDEAAEQLASTTPLHEVRINALNSMNSADTSSDWDTTCSTVPSNASTCMPSEMNSPRSYAESRTLSESDADPESPRSYEHLRNRLLSADKCKSVETPCLPCAFDENCERLGGEDSTEEVCTTTLLIRSLPRSMSRATLEQWFDAEGFAGQYDFMYLPTNLKVRECYGYGFINLVSVTEARRFARHFHGHSWPESHQEPMGVHASKALHGLDALVGRYRNSPLMHHTVPEEWRPAIYRDGMKVPFPRPTARLRAPRCHS